MIKFQETKPGYSGPFIVCDKCGKTLVDDKGIILIGPEGAISSYCKVTCDPRTSGHGWHDIGVFLSMLAVNTKTDVLAADRTRQIMEGIHP